MNLYSKTVEYMKKNIPMIMVTVVSKTGQGPVNVGKKMLVAKNGDRFGTVGGGALEYDAIERCKELLVSGESLMKKYLLNDGNLIEDAETLPMVCGGVVELFFDYVGSKGYVTIFGGGHCGQALLKVLKTMDYHVTIVDHRPDVYDQISGADRKVNSDYASFIDEEGLMDDSFVIIMTPSHKYDYQVMHKVLEKKIKPKYFGMLCSKEKLKDFMAITYETFGEDIDLRNFYSPIGLKTGGGSPEEIAVSIAAEMLAVEYGKEGHRHMRDV